MSDEDDKATVVIDLNKLRKEKEKQEKDLANVAESLEFNLNNDSEEAVSPTIPGSKPTAPVMSSLPVVMFEFGKNHFAKLKANFPQGFQFHHVAELPELNGWIKKKIPFVLCLPLDVNPKAVNQLCVQLRAKYPHIHVVVVSQLMGPDKIALHQKSPARAAAYMGYPFASADFKVVLDRFARPKAA